MILCIVLYAIGFIILNNSQTGLTSTNSKENWVLECLFVVFPFLIILAVVCPSAVLIYKISFTVITFAYFSTCCLKLIGFKVSNIIFWEGLTLGAGFLVTVLSIGRSLLIMLLVFFIAALIFYLQSKSVLVVAHTLYLFFMLIIYLLGSMIQTLNIFFTDGFLDLKKLLGC